MIGSVGRTLANPQLHGGIKQLLAPFPFAAAAALAYSVQPIAIPTSSSVRTQFTATGTDPIDYGVVVVADGALAPTAADVLAGTVAGAIASLTGVTAESAVQETSLSLSGLSAATDFDLYVAIDDAVSSPLLSDLVNFTTSASGVGGLTRDLTSDLTSDLTNDLTN